MLVVAGADVELVGARVARWRDIMILVGGGGMGSFGLGVFLLTCGRLVLC